MVHFNRQGAGLWAVLLFFLLMGIPAVQAETVVDDFNGELGGWQSEMAYGDVSATTASRGEGIDGSGALRVAFAFHAQGTNHLLFARKTNLDLSWADSISFTVRGSGDRALVFLFLYDSQGRLNNYGAHASNTDFHTGYGDWHTCRVDLRRDHCVQGGDADLSDIRRVGLFFWSNKPVRGTAWVDNLCYQDGDRSANLQASPDSFSPNGDGVCDTVTLTSSAPREAALTLEILDADGKTVAVLQHETPQRHRMESYSWDGRVAGKPVPAGEYTARARFTGPNAAACTTPVHVERRDKWPPLHYRNAPFFPVGVWFEGNPGAAGYPSDPVGARKYYDRCFADLAAHGFNAAAVPNCPETLWEPLLQAAQQHGIGICLEPAPLVALVNRQQPPTEAEVAATVRAVVAKIGKYRSLIRYQVRDEPPPALVPNWLLVQRILAAVDPRRPAFSCFCSAEALALVSRQTTLAEAVFDDYPIRQATPQQSLGDFLPLFDAFAKAAKDRPLWAVLQDFGELQNATSWRYPTPEELRAQTYLSLAGGSKGIFFFIYSHMPGYLDGLVGADGAAQPLYAPTATLARELRRLAPLLLTLKPAAPVQMLPDARVGHFTGRQGKPVLILANARPGEATHLTVPVEKTVWKDALTGERFTAEAGNLAITLAPGAGRVLVGQ